MKIIDIIALVLVIIGGLNWALVGVANIDFVAMIFGASTVLAKTVYVAVGIAALYSLTFFKPVTDWANLNRSVTHIPPAQPVR